MTRSETSLNLTIRPQPQGGPREMQPLRPRRTKPHALFILDEDVRDFVFSSDQLREFAQLAEVHGGPHTRQAIRAQPQLLTDIEVVIASWHMPVLDAELLEAAPCLKLVLYAAGSVKYFATPAMWQRGIIVSSGAYANAIPVAEFTLAQIILCLKNVWNAVRMVRKQRTYVRNRWPCAGTYQSTVGLVSLGLIGRMTCQKLRQMDVNLIAYDPTVDEEAAAAMGVSLCSLEEVFARSDVISLHTPLLKETEGLVDARYLSLMKPNAALINTARGEIINELELVATLKRRPDITAVLDVVCDEPAPEDSELYQLDNVVLTPHIAGSVGNECLRLGRHMIDELQRYLAGEPLQYAVSERMTSTMA